MDRLRIHVKELMSIGEKIMNTKEKLMQVDPDKIERAREWPGVALPQLRAYQSSWYCSVMEHTALDIPYKEAVLAAQPNLRCQTKCDDLKTAVDKLYERLADIEAQVSTSRIDAKKPEHLGLDLVGNRKKTFPMSLKINVPRPLKTLL